MHPGQPYAQPRTVPVTAEAGASRFLTRVHGYMAAGLAITALTAMIVASSPALLQVFVFNRIVFYGLIIAELALVWVFSSRAATASVASSVAMLTAYAVINGLTFSVIFLAYTGAAIGRTFLVTAGMFAGMSAYGALTGKRLDSWGAFGIMGVWGVLLASLVNLFFASAALDFAISVCGVIAFVALTAYDTQKIKAAYSSDAAKDDLTRIALAGALALYLDFVNLFLFLLRLLGGRRD